jgi:hypothetical protein
MNAPDTVGAALIGVLEGADDGERVIRQANTPAYGIVMKVITQLVEVRGAIIHGSPFLSGRGIKSIPTAFSGQTRVLFFYCIQVVATMQALS